MDFVPIFALAALIYKLVDFVRYFTKWQQGGKNGVVTQLLCWGVAIVAVILYAQSNWAMSLPIAGFNFHQLNLASQIIVGLQFGSLASAGKDIVKAVDRTDSARIPTLLTPASPGKHRAPDETGQTL